MILILKTAYIIMVALTLAWFVTSCGTREVEFSAKTERNGLNQSCVYGLEKGVKYTCTVTIDGLLNCSEVEEPIQILGTY